MGLQLCLQQTQYGQMVFYGIKNDYTPEIEALGKRIDELMELKAQKQQKTENQFQLPALNKKVGEVITQAIVSSQFALSCIGDYFQRQYYTPGLLFIAPAAQIYQQVPPALTELKYEFVDLASVKQRISVSAILTMLAFSRSISKHKGNLLKAGGRSTVLFAGLTWLLVPQFGIKYSHMIAHAL